MIHALRNVRHHLLSENKFTRYLAYGLGEIVLVIKRTPLGSRPIAAYCITALGKGFLPAATSSTNFGSRLYSRAKPSGFFFSCSINSDWYCSRSVGVRERIQLWL